MGVGRYLTDREWRGVWLLNVPLDVNEGAEGDTLLRVVIPVRVIAEFEWIEEGKSYREWLVPAQLLNEHSRVRVVED